MRKIAVGKGILNARQQEILERYQGSDQKTIDSELTALLTEELIGNEQFIDKVVAEQPNIAMRIVKKIQNLIKLFKMSGEKRAEYKVLTLAENMYLRSAYDHGRQNLIQIIEQGREDNKQVQVAEQNDEVGVDQTLALQYNKKKYEKKKFSFHHGNFPSQSGSAGSEAHRLAIWWTRRPNIVAGDQTLISMNDRWYLVEKFDDADNGYQVEDYITKSEYNKIFEEIKQNGRSGKILSIQRAFANYDKFDKLNYSIKGRKPSIDSLQTQYSGEDSQLLRVDKTKSSRREFESNRRGDSESGGSSKQGIDYSLKDSQGKELSQQQAEYFRDSNLNPTSDQDIRYSLKGISKDGIEIYETSEEIRKLPYKERKELFLRKLTEEYKGRTAKFTRNGHSYYATFDYHDINKNINGDRRSDNKGYRAKISAGADGDIFEIIENAQYNGSKPEVGNKKSAAHKNVSYWDYFIKTIQIDGIVFDLVVNIRKKTDSQYVYSIQLRENKKVVSSPLIEVMTDKSAPSLNRVLNDTTNNSISQNIENATFLEEKNIKLSRKSPAPSQVGDIIKARGNLTTDKIFTKAEAKKIIADIEERLFFEDKGMVGTIKGTNELIDQLWKGLNKANKGEYIGVGVKIADYVINHTVVEDIYETLSGDVEVEEARQVIKTLKQYFHKVKISDRVLGEIKYHFDDKAGKVLALWRAKEGGLADKINNDTKSQTVLTFFLQ